MAGFDKYEYEDMKSLQPRGYAEYMSNYGEHFSKALCEWAVARMKDRNGKKLDPWDMKTVEQMLTKYGIVLDNDKGYDKVFVMNMGRSDYYGSSITDEAHLAMYVKDVLDDKDGYEGIAFNRFFADCMAKGVPIIWEDVL